MYAEKPRTIPEIKNKISEEIKAIKPEEGYDELLKKAKNAQIYLGLTWSTFYSSKSIQDRGIISSNIVFKLF